MENYWANFNKINGHLHRFDTRIYLEPISEIRATDTCIGAIIGKNPGSALPKNEVYSKLCPIQLSGDKLLPTVKNLISNNLKGTQTGKYVQVLNLFYLCEKDLHHAIKTSESFHEEILCSTESKTFPWVWLMWGGYHHKLQSKKERFKNIKSDVVFFLNSSTNEIEENFPNDKTCAKHTQGMSHDLVNPYLGKLLS